MADLNLTTSAPASAPPQQLLITNDVLQAVLPPLRLFVACVSIMGFATNLANIIVFFKIGLTTSTNVCFFSLAVADIISVAWIFLLVLTPFVSEDGMIISMAAVVEIITSQVFYGASAFGSWATAIISMERCCAIVFPLKVKSIFTRNVVAALILLMVLFEVSASVPYYLTFTLVAVPSSTPNRSILVIDKATRNKALAILVRFVSFSVPTFICYVLVVCGTVLLVTSFRKSLVARKSMTGDRPEKSSNKDNRVVTSVIFICVIYIIGFFVAVFKFFTSMFYPQLHVYDPYLGNFTILLTTYGFCLQAIACSTNIFVYLKLNTRYRLAFLEILSCKN